MAIAQTLYGTVTLDSLTASELIATGASKELVSLAVDTYPSLAELSYVKGLTSDLQTQLDARLKLDQTTPQTIANGQPVQSTLTASEIVATDGDKKLQSLAVATYPSLTELSYVKGLASAVQTQLDARLKLDQTTPQTVTASPIWNWGTATRVPFYSATKTLTDSAYFTWNDTNKQMLISGNTAGSILTLKGKNPNLVLDGSDSGLNSPQIKFLNSAGASGSFQQVRGGLSDSGVIMFETEQAHPYCVRVARLTGWTGGETSGYNLGYCFIVAPTGSDFGYVGIGRYPQAYRDYPQTPLEVRGDGSVAQLRLSYYTAASGVPTVISDFKVDSSGDLTLTVSGDNFKFASSTANTDLIFSFIGTTNSGEFKWMEDEDYFQFADDIKMTDNETIVLGGTGFVDSPKYKAGGTDPVADGTYTVGIGGTTNGTITIKGGIITAVQEAVA